jgi:hypothetical protein
MRSRRALGRGQSMVSGVAFEAQGGQRLITAKQRKTVRMVKELAALLRRDEPSEWPGLRLHVGELPSRTGASLFTLGCAIDGGLQQAVVGWRGAQRFVFGIVPRKHREDMWEWIVRRHTTSQWRHKRTAYGLHGIRAWHQRVYRFAEFIAAYCNGDAREIWNRVPDGVQPIDHVRSILFAMRFGPALSRMFVGGLLDHGLLQGDSAFKDDIHVKRAMYRLGLAPSQQGAAVLDAGLRFFGKNNWDIDLALYRLGTQGYKTRRQIERYHRQRILEKRDERVTKLWHERRRGWLAVVRKALENAADKLRTRGWNVTPSNGKGYVGFSVDTKRGVLGTEFNNKSLYVWIGASVNVPEACMEAWSEVEFDINGKPARSSVLRDQLRAEGYICSYNDADEWETHYRTMRDYSMSARPENISRGLTARLAREAEKTVDMLEAIAR